MPKKVHELSNLHPSSCPHLVSVRQRFARWNWMIDNGYIRYFYRGQMIYEHRLVASASVGLPRRYHVHHIDETRTNNAASNLLVLSASEHARLHASQKQGFVGDKPLMECPVCHAAFQPSWGQMNRDTPSYCSVRCCRIASRKVKRPSADELRRILSNAPSWLEVGRMFGVSDNAVRKWARSYQIDFSICDGRLKTR